MAFSEKLSRLSARAALAAAVIGPALCVAGLVAPMTGFGIFALSLPLALAAGLAAAVALVSGRAADRRATRRSLLLALVVLALMVGAGGAGLGKPPINDISTDTEDPPAFAKASELKANRGRDMSYPGADCARQQHEAYPGLAPLVSSWPPGEAVAKVEAVLLTLPRTEITDLDPAAGRIEAVSSTRIFRFVDDVVVRVRAEGDGSRIDVRSKSRDGRGDLGANATRIQTLLEQLR